MVVRGHRVAIFLPLLLVLSAGLSYGDVNLFNSHYIALDPITSAAIAPFDGSSPRYPAPGAYFPDGFQLANILHLTAFNRVNIFRVIVDGAPDGPSNPFRSFTYFNLISYTFANITNPNAYQYTLHYNEVPTTDGDGHENITADGNLQNVSTYSADQFGTDPSTGNSGPRVCDVVVTTPEPSAFLALLPFGVLGGCALGRRLRRRRG
jgi:hypothetical protein